MSKRILGLALFGVGLVGCSLLSSLDGYSGGTVADAGRSEPVDSALPPGPDPDAATSADADATLGCVHARPPARPGPQPGPVVDGGNDTIVGALASYTFASTTSPGNPSTRGYDLDGLCTCPERRACSLAGTASDCDVAGGIDNAGGKLLHEALTLLGGEASGASDGDNGLLVRVRNYNGLADDDAVEVALFDTMGAEVRQGSNPGKLKNDGTDRWTVDSRALLGGTPYLPVVVDTRAYVSGGKVVAELRSTFRVGFVSFPVSHGYLTATLTRTATGYTFTEGSISVRVNARAFLTALEGVATTTGHLCGNDLIYLSVRDRICKARDLPTDPSVDGRETPCDAFSLIMEFSARPAQLGNVIVPPTAPRPCGDSWEASCP